MSDRASRLRERRNRSKEKAQSQVEPESESEEPEPEQSEETEDAQPSKTEKTDETEQTEEPEEPESSEESEPEESDDADNSEDSEEKDSPSLKDEQVGTYLYLPEDQRDEMSFRYKMLTAEYEREFGEDLEKNRHYYPLVIEYGLGRLNSATPHEVREMLEELDY